MNVRFGIESSTLILDESYIQSGITKLNFYVIRVICLEKKFTFVQLGLIQCNCRTSSLIYGIRHNDTPLYSFTSNALTLMGHRPVRNSNVDFR